MSGDRPFLSRCPPPVGDLSDAELREAVEGYCRLAHNRRQFNKPDLSPGQAKRLGEIETEIERRATRERARVIVATRADIDHEEQ